MANKKRSERLQTVLRLAELRQQAAAEQLARSVQNAQAQQQQGEQLERYQQEYSEQYKSGASEGFNAQQLQNFQRFFSNLDSAMETQQETIALAKGQQQQSRDQWQQQYARQKKMAGLVDRVAFGEEQDEEKKLQRELDDRFRARKP